MKIKNYYAKLEGKKVVPVESLMDILDYFPNAPSEDGVDKRRVAKTEIGDVMISTVFLAINHGGWSYSGKDLWFETMIFGGEHNEFQNRYETYEQAEAGHEKAVRLVKGEISEAEAHEE